MGKMNMKLMQGIGETEGLFQKEKQSETYEIPAAKKEQKDTESEGEKNAPSDSSKKTYENTKKTESPKSKIKTKKKEDTDKKDKQVFSFRATLSDISTWRFFATSTSQTMEQMASSALNEYVSKHKLSDTERMVFEALMAREKQ